MTADSDVLDRGELSQQSTEPHDWLTDGDRRMCRACGQIERKGQGTGTWLKVVLGEGVKACSGYKTTPPQGEEGA